MNENSFKFDSPATYCIHVQGMMDSSWSDRLGGLDIQPDKKMDDKSTTILCGRLMDQAALLGILNTLYTMHYPLLSVTYVEDE